MGAQLFPKAQKFINRYDLRKISDVREIGKAEGIYAVFGDEEIEMWIQKQQNKTFEGTVVEPRTLDVSQTYSYNQEIDMSGVNVAFIHAPGHTEGFCTPYLVDYGILHIGDIDLTSFGPYYGDAESDIDQFIESAKRTLEVDAKYFVTSHHKGIISKQEYEMELEKYLSIIERREEKIKRAIKKGCSPEELMQQEVLYYRNQSEHNSIRRKSEKISIVKHLKRLIKHGEPYTDYYDSFIRVNNINEQYIDYYNNISEVTGISRGNNDI